MKISERTIENCQIFDIDGDISFDETQEMENFVFSRLSVKYSKVIMNFKGVPYLNSSSLGSLVRILQGLKTKNTSLYLMNVNQDITNLFSITGMNRYFTFIADEMQAV
ncbi:MAG: STAS domain-containing protein [Spirochaetes bacterium]|nr:STAS domain-containing protein [Spirochaetota bacterium]